MTENGVLLIMKNMTTPQSSGSALEKTAVVPFELWDNSVPVPDFKTIDEPATITHTRVERAQPGGYHYLHESSLAFHNDKLYVAYANHPRGEINVLGEVLRGNVAHGPDYLNFGPAQEWIHAPMAGGCSYNHAVLASHQNKLWCFATRWEGYTQAYLESQERANPGDMLSIPGVEHVLGCELFHFDETTNTWNAIGVNVPTFIPFGKPLKLKNGNWLISGESFWFQAAVIISEGDDWTKWHMVAVTEPKSPLLHFPETTVWDQGDRLIAACRPRGIKGMPVSISEDCGETWTPLQESNLRVADSQPFAGRLSTGEHFLLTNHPDEKRAMLTIALTSPGGRTFNRMLKIRHQQYPLRRLWEGSSWKHGKLIPEKTMVGTTTEWSYPFADEHQGKLYISYTMGKEDCYMTVIPIHALQG